MVKRRKRPVEIPRATRCLIDRLPNELLDEEFKILDTKDLKLLRRTSKFFAEYLLPHVCKTVIGERIKASEDLVDLVLQASRSLEVAKALHHDWHVDGWTMFGAQHIREKVAELSEVLRNLDQLRLIINFRNSFDYGLWCPIERATESINTVLQAATGPEQTTRIWLFPERMRGLRVLDQPTRIAFTLRRYKRS